MTMDEPGYLNVPDLRYQILSNCVMAVDDYTEDDALAFSIGMEVTLKALLDRGLLNDIGIEQLRASQERMK